ncbi:hypothetical protein ACFE04_029288 [Oxalis oulophora]
MASPLLLLLLLVLIFIIKPSSSTELTTLLTFKSSLEDPNNSLSTWSKSNSHYCNWTGVTCDNLNNLITSLNLQSLNLSGQISPTLCDLTSLTYLNLANNNFNTPIPLHLVTKCISLETLNLSNNLIWSTIPDQVSLLKSIKVVDFSRNHIEGKIPLGFGSLVKLKVLNLGSNLLSGKVDGFVFMNCSELSVLDLSQNVNLISEIPSEIGKLGELDNLLLQSSGFYGEIPKSFVGLTKLTMFDLSQNNLTGFIPKGLGGSLKNLVVFDVSQNKLSGSFPDGVCSSLGLKSLSLFSNLFNGSIPDSINGCLKLERFQIQNNGFSGDFPTGLLSLSNIKLIRAENNRFSGELPDSISMAAQLEQMQIDNNSFTGRIPKGLGFVKNLYRFSASLNGFSGEIPPNFCDSPVMSILNLSHNALSGKIPELKKCRKLVSLSLADNSLTGEIPNSLSDLPVLTYLDLSDNSLSGSIPQGLQNLKLALFNMSYNHLSGKVPSSLISGLPASYLQGNPGLCGPGLSNSCTNDGEPGHHILNLTTLACVLISVGFTLGIVILAALFIVFHRYNKRKSEMGSWKSVFFYPLRITEQDLSLGMDEKAAVSNFSLPWDVRIKIAIGVAQGLAYLHKHYVPHLLHRNLKSKNILLDAEFEPKLTDFAFDRIIGETAFQSTMVSECSKSCYLAPEHGYTKKSTEQIDVYSFGVVLLELITGRHAEQPAEQDQSESLDILKWVRRKVNISNGTLQVLDPKILSAAYQQQMLGALDIALHCTAVLPEKRPAMIEIVKSLQSLS